MTKQPRFVFWFIFFAILFLAGVYTDGWAHRHIGNTLETFFTPWHALMYGAFFLTAGTLGIAWFKGYRMSHNIRQALPNGYGLSLIGALVFLFGGVADLIWHTLFGIEIGVDALISPSHLVLSVGAALTVSGPLRYSWQKENTATIITIISAALFLSTLTFMTEYIHPFGNPWGRNDRVPVITDDLLVQSDIGATGTFFLQSVSEAGIMFHTALLIALILMLIRRFGTLPRGSLTLMLTLNGAYLVGMSGNHEFLPCAIIAGIVGDIFLHKYKSKTLFEHPQTLRGLSVLVPMVFYTAYTFTVLVTGGTWWTIHFWTGSIVIAGIVGLLMSYVFVPPRTRQN